MKRLSLRIPSLLLMLANGGLASADAISWRTHDASTGAPQPLWAVSRKASTNPMWPIAPFTTFNGLVAYDASIGTASSDGLASQNSSVSGTLFSGSGSIEANAFIADSDERSESSGVSFFIILFALSEPHAFNLSGELSVQSRFTTTMAILRLSGPVRFSFAQSNGFQSIDHTGVLPAGHYSFSPAWREGWETPWE
jgi:hypothetical protein